MPDTSVVPDVVVSAPVIVTLLRLGAVLPLRVVVPLNVTVPLPRVKVPLFTQLPVRVMGCDEPPTSRVTPLSIVSTPPMVMGFARVLVPELDKVRLKKDCPLALMLWPAPSKITVPPPAMKVPLLAHDPATLIC